MKKILLSLAAAIIAMVAQAQIMMTPYVDATIGGLDENNTQLVENRLRSIISAAGMESSYNTRFILATRINLLDREFTSTAPVRMIQKLQVTLAIGDGMSGICFGSTTFEVKGIGETEQQAMLQACKSIPKSNAQIRDLVATAKERIFSYYEANASAIIAHAKSLEQQQEYEAALNELAAIPQECSQYKTAMAMMSKIAKSNINHDAAQLLAEAQAVWSADPNPGPSADMAMSILSQINTDAKCYPQAQALMKKIEARTKAVTDRQYADDVAYRNAKLKAETTLEKARIKAVRDVAVAYAKSRPRVVYHVHTWW